MPYEWVTESNHSEGESMAGAAESGHFLQPHFLKGRTWRERQRVIIFCGKGMTGAAGGNLFLRKRHDGSGRGIHFLREGHDGSRERGIYI